MTNAERIQTMPDDELLELLEWLESTGYTRTYTRLRAWLGEEADCSDGSKSKED